MKSIERTERAKQLLLQNPMTRFELECRLGTTQPRVSEILRSLGARVVGQERAPGKGRPAPIYALGEQPQVSAHIGRVSSVWQLGTL